MVEEKKEQGNVQNSEHMLTKDNVPMQAKTNEHMLTLFKTLKPFSRASSHVILSKKLRFFKVKILVFEKDKKAELEYNQGIEHMHNERVKK